MRHLMAFAFLEANPGDYEGARQLLGHKQITTTINFYAGAESAAAFRRLDRLVDHMRDVVLNEETGEPEAFELRGRAVMKKKFAPLDLGLWPPLDRKMWIAAKQPGDPFEKAGLAAEWRA